MLISMKDVLQYIVVEIDNIVSELENPLRPIDPHLVACESAAKTKLSAIATQIDTWQQAKGIKSASENKPDQPVSAQVIDSAIDPVDDPVDDIVIDPVIEGLCEAQIIDAKTKLMRMLSSLTVSITTESGWLMVTKHTEMRRSFLADRIQQFNQDIFLKIDLMRVNQSKLSDDKKRKEQTARLDRLEKNMAKLEATQESQTMHTSTLTVYHREHQELMFFTKKLLNVLTPGQIQQVTCNLAIEYDKDKEIRPDLLKNAATFPLGIKHKYLSNFVPNENIVQCYPFEGAVSSFSFADSILRAISASHLIGYYMKLRGEPVSVSKGKHFADYKRESQLVKVESIHKILSVSFLYLFLEYKKTWKEMLADPLNPVFLLAAIVAAYSQKGKNQQLQRLGGVLHKISNLKTTLENTPAYKANPVDLEAQPEERETNADGSWKKPHQLAGKHAYSFFKNNKYFMSPDLAKVCLKFYRADEEPDHKEVEGIYRSLTV